MNKATLLIVDDEPTNLAVLNEVLRKEYRILAARSGQQALDILRHGTLPDLVLLDVMMPEMDGYSVIRALKSNDDTKNIPVIFVTALGSEQDEYKGLEFGAADYISKPISPSILRVRIKNHLVLKQAQDYLVDKNEFLSAEVSRRLQENQIVQNVSIRALAHLAETRDPETGDHILRTQAYVNTLARRLQTHPRFKGVLTDHYIELVTKSAPLHDIGKVGIPDNILLKPGKLTAEEWAIMQTHAEIGAKAIERAESDVDQQVEFLGLAKQIAQSHHERWDGTGYPQGLKGDEIPLSARLMALADVFDALISKRVYKPAVSFEETREIILQGRDGQFDPDIVDAFDAAFDEFVAIANRYKEVTDLVSA